jgi:hypothetical protein
MMMRPMDNNVWENIPYQYKNKFHLNPVSGATTKEIQ